MPGIERQPFAPRRDLFGGLDDDRIDEGHGVATDLIQVHDEQPHGLTDLDRRHAGAVRDLGGLQQVAG
jgi:hypothetical protein